MKHVGSDEAPKAGEALNGALRAVREFDQHEGDQGDGYLNAHCVVTCAEEVPQFQRLLDPPKE
jgi:hypothetical protein